MFRKMKKKGIQTKFFFSFHFHSFLLVLHPNHSSFSCLICSISIGLSPSNLQFKFPVVVCLQEGHLFVFVDDELCFWMQMLQNRKCKQGKTTVSRAFSMQITHLNKMSFSLIFFLISVFSFLISVISFVH